MPLTLGTDAFIPTADADSYFAGRLRADAWINADTDAREKALRMATAMLNRERYVGRITSTSQALAWPRAGVVDDEGRLLPSEKIPEPITHATAELALALLKDDLTDDRTRRQIYRLRSERIGESQSTFEPSSHDELPAIVRALIAPYLRTAGGSSAPLIP